MKTKVKITVCGGDKRFLTAYKLFSADGYDCRYITGDSFNAISDTDILILPIPSFDREGNLNGTHYTVYDLFGAIRSGTVIFAGKVPGIIKRIAEEYKIRLYDYTDNEEFNILNAVSTAEGAILTALERSQTIICGSHFTVLGYGRIGRALAVRLKALGGDVTVGARSCSARALCATDAVRGMAIEDALSTDSAVIFNTVPAPIITEENAASVKAKLIIDLASIPGGLTERAKLIAGENFIHALSLPGKCFPDTAGRTIYRTITSLIQEKGVSM